MIAMCSWTLIWIFLFSLLVSSFTNYPNYEVSPGPAGFVSLLLLWVLMLVHFAKNNELQRKVWWGLFLILFPWVGGVVYFLRIYYPQNKINIIESFKSSSPKSYKITIALCTCVAITILHQFFFSNFYLTFGIPFPQAYTMIVNKIIYFPVYALLTTAYKLFDVDTSGEISRQLALLVSTTDLLYTMVLYLFAYYLIIRLKSYKRG